MKIRKTLNGLMPRTARDACRDPWDWFEASPRPDTPAEQIAGFILALVIAVGLAAYAFAWLGS